MYFTLWLNNPLGDNLFNDYEFERIQSDAERIAEAKLYSMMTLPEKALDSWDEIEQNIKNKLNQELEVQSDKLKNTLARYKDVVEKAMVR